MRWMRKAGYLKVCCLAYLKLFLLASTAFAQPDPLYTLSTPLQAAHIAPISQTDLFASEDVLRFKLLIDYKALLKDRGDERSYHPATIQYQEQNGKITSVNLKVRVRGNHRRDPSVCKFPPLLLNFPKKKVELTAFAGVDKLKLVTHCIGEKYVMREYLVYKLYNIVTHHSYKVRLCLIDYEDVQGSKKTTSSYAFLIEETESLADRSKGTIMAKELLIRMDATDDRTMAKLALFQFMIGNTDWSVPYRHNILLLYVTAYGKPVPVPYDFDYTGIVMPPYAKPPPEIGITSVRQRIFRGYSFPEEVLEELVPFFNNRKEAFYQVYATSLLDEKYKKQTLKYLDDFYEIINKPKDFERHIVKAGQQNERMNVVVKGLD
ncbi:hypothetical protein [Pontibacter cellulosilyticus]|uniref:Uncharacterized protein n=1 Tax=Pontibacter cellulosilyticus TaxID=1720253 RepID=A0A923N4A3_9BACT|nr:hypothetical protein [Pontibacter cellulosilyticus]MBC5992625.1 hypothetical protein [Pontibacter cellulosilyticus]